MPDVNIITTTQSSGRHTYQYSTVGTPPSPESKTLHCDVVKCVCPLAFVSAETSQRSVAQLGDTTAYVLWRQNATDSLTTRAPTLSAITRSALLSSAALLHESQHRPTASPSLAATTSSALRPMTSVSRSLLFHRSKQRPTMRTANRCCNSRLWYSWRQRAHASLRSAASRRLRTVCMRMRMSARQAAFCLSCKCVCQRTSATFRRYASARASARVARSRCRTNAARHLWTVTRSTKVSRACAT